MDRDGGIFTGTGDALSAAVAGLRFVARADAGSLPGGELADCLRGLEQAESVLTAARARVLAAFNVQGIFEADGQRGCGRGWPGRPGSPPARPPGPPGGRGVSPCTRWPGAR